MNMCPRPDLVPNKYSGLELHSVEIFFTSFRTEYKGNIFSFCLFIFVMENLSIFFIGFSAIKLPK